MLTTEITKKTKATIATTQAVFRIPLLYLSCKRILKLESLISSNRTLLINTARKSKIYGESKMLNK